MNPEANLAIVAWLPSIILSALGGAALAGAIVYDHGPWGIFSRLRAWDEKRARDVYEKEIAQAAAALVEHSKDSPQLRAPQGCSGCQQGPPMPPPGMFPGAYTSMPGMPPGMLGQHPGMFPHPNAISGSPFSPGQGVPGVPTSPIRCVRCIAFWTVCILLAACWIGWWWLSALFTAYGIAKLATRWMA